MNNLNEPVSLNSQIPEREKIRKKSKQRSMNNLTLSKYKWKDWQDRARETCTQFIDIFTK